MGRPDRDIPAASVGWLRVMLFAYGLLTLWMLTYPFTPEQPGADKALFSEWHLGKINTVSNIALFVPFGLLGAMIGSIRRRSAAVTVIGMTLAAAAISFAAEAMQVHLRERDSSLIDLVANAFGGFAGAAVGMAARRRLVAWWAAVGRWLAARPWARAALAVWVVIFALRMAPFDLSLETYYLKEKVLAAIHAGGPFATARDWTLAAINAALLCVGVVALGRAMREGLQRCGERGAPWIALLIIGVLLAVACEAVQLAVRSRALDLSEPIGAVAGALVGVVIDLVMGRVQVRGGRGGAAEARPSGDR